MDGLANWLTDREKWVLTLLHTCTCVDNHLGSLSIFVHKAVQPNLGKVGFRSQQIQCCHGNHYTLQECVTKLHSRMDKASDCPTDNCSELGLTMAAVMFMLFSLLNMSSAGTSLHCWRNALSSSVVERPANAGLWRQNIRKQRAKVFLRSQSYYEL